MKFYLSDFNTVGISDRFADFGVRENGVQHYAEILIFEMLIGSNFLRTISNLEIFGLCIFSLGVLLGLILRIFSLQKFWS